MQPALMVEPLCWLRKAGAAEVVAEQCVQQGAGQLEQPLQDLAVAGQEIVS